MPLDWNVGDTTSRGFPLPHPETPQGAGGGEKLDIARIGIALRMADAEITALAEADAALAQALAVLDAALAGKAASATTLAGYGITDAYTKSAIDTALAGMALFQGSQPTLAALAAAKPTGATGHWAVLTNGAGVAASIAAWDTDNSPAQWVDTKTAAPTSMAWTAITGKPTTVAGFGITDIAAHPHSIAQVTGLETALAGKASVATSAWSGPSA